MAFLLVEFGAQAGQFLSGLGLFVGFAGDSLPGALFVIKSFAMLLLPSFDILILGHFDSWQAPSGIIRAESRLLLR